MKQAYFCGHSQRCKILGNAWALDHALKNAKQFKVIATLEKFKESLPLLEMAYPEFLNGIAKLESKIESKIWQCNSSSNFVIFSSSEERCQRENQTFKRSESRVEVIAT